MNADATPFEILANASIRYQKAIKWRQVDSEALGDLATAVGITHGEYRLDIISSEAAIKTYVKLLATAHIEGHRAGFEEAQRLQGLTIPDERCPDHGTFMPCTLNHERKR